MSSSLIMLDELEFSPGFSPASVWISDPGHPRNQQWYQHYSSWAKYSNASSSTYGSFSITFEGSSIAFTGNTPPGTKKQTFSVSIDGVYKYVASYPSKHTYMQWYMSPTLEEGNHTITLTEMDGTDVDYALVGVGSQTVLGKDILVDSTSNTIVWVGDWQTNTSTLKHTNDFHIVNHPLGNSTKDSKTVGDSFSFKFTGTTVSVFGIQRKSINGSISADFSVDGGENTTFSTTNAGLGNDLANTMFFSSPILHSGIHTLVMNITAVAGDQSLKLDYITYSNQESNGNNSSSPSSSSASPSSSNLLSGSSTPDSARKVTNSKRIVGGVVGGGIALLLIIASALIWWRRRRQVYLQDNLMSSSQPFTYNLDQSIIRQAESSVPVPSRTEQKFKTRQKNEGISVAESTLSVGPSHMPPSSPTLSRRESASGNQGEIRCGPDLINNLRGRIERPSTDMTQIQELQNRIEMLTEENSRLMEVPPPAYGD